MKKFARSMAQLVAVVFAAVAMLASGAHDAHAQQPSKSGLAMSYQNVSIAHDTARSHKAKANEVAANDTLRYSLVFTNNQGRALRNVVFDNPMPANLQLIAGTVTTSAPAKVEYSIDGGVTYSAQPMVTILDAGRTTQKPAIPASYTNIRWTVASELAAGARVTAQFDTRVALRPSPRPAMLQK